MRANTRPYADVEQGRKPVANRVSTGVFPSSKAHLNALKGAASWPSSHR